MTLVFNGHTLNYEIESLCKLFFPAKGFVQLSNSYDKPEDNYIITTLTTNEEISLLAVEISYNGGEYHDSGTICVTHPDYQNECEQLFGRMIYRILSTLLDIHPKWGILTGIRPVVRVHKMRAKGYSDGEIRSILADTYLVTKEKIDLAFKIANNQRVVLEDITKKDYSLYVSIPFCPSRCSYCSFVSQSINNAKAMALVPQYIDRLCEELSTTAYVAKELGLNLRSIYIGGGTPTAITASQLEQVTNAISANFDVSLAQEYTVEAGRADSITREKLAVIKDSGATRISINPQTFNDNVLEVIGRNHTAKQVIDCYNMAVEMGFTDINMDFIAGLPTDTLDSFKHTIDTAVSLNPANITVHTLALKKSSSLYGNEKDQTILPQDQTEQMVLYASQTLQSNGYEPYYMYRQKNTLQNLENIGYAKKGYYSYYNIYIMEEVMAILATGAGGVSKLIDFTTGRFDRSFNFKFHFEYLDRFDQVIKRKLDFLK